MIDRVGIVCISVADQDRSKGVAFVQEPDVQPWGTFATIQDSEGNRLILVEPTSGVPG